MKKVLSIMASIGLIATTATTVIACATNDNNNANVSFNQVRAWFNNAQPTNDQEGKTMLIAIGGRRNSDMISYLATLNSLLNNNQTTNVNDITNQENLNRLENTLSNYTLDSQETNPSWQRPMQTMINALSSRDWENDPNQSSIIAEQYFKQKIAKPIKQMEFHTILVDQIENFWSSELGKNLVREILAPQIKEFLNFVTQQAEQPTDNALEDLVNNQERYDAFLRRKTTNMLNAFQDNQSGPWFLVVRSGKLVGIKTGFRNYYEFNRQISRDDQRDHTLTRATIVRQIWTQFSESIAQGLRSGIDWLLNNYNNIDREINDTNFFTKNAPTTTTENAAAWRSNTSSTSNIDTDDLENPRGEEPEEENPGNNESLSSYHFPFLD